MSRALIYFTTCIVFATVACFINNHSNYVFLIIMLALISCAAFLAGCVRGIAAFIEARE